jgi:hypothetical protein
MLINDLQLKPGIDFCPIHIAVYGVPITIQLSKAYHFIKHYLFYASSRMIVKSYVLGFWERS